jgi:hypothetical protein
MTSRELIRWAILAYLVTLAMLIGTMCMMPASSDNAIANFAKFMITQVYPLFAIVPVLAVYSICVRRWQPILGGLIGNLAFFPLTIALAIVFGFVIGLPVEAWRDGNHVVVVALTIAYCSLAILLTRKWVKRRRSQPSPGAYSSKAADGLTGNAQE